MFYRQEEVDQNLSCGICSGIYEDPRLLPCSESACFKCIQTVIESNPQKEFDCKFCHKKHTSPGKEGFPLNGALIKFLKTSAGKVYRNAKVEELETKLAEIKNKCRELKLSSNNGVDQIRERCILLRNQVHLETDILIEEAQTFKQSLIKEIEKYKKDCIKSFESNADQRENQLDKFILEMTQFHTVNASYLTKFEIKDKVVDEAVSKAKNNLRRFKIEENSLKKIQFNNKIAEFRKCQDKHDSTLLGRLTYKSVNFDLSNLKQLTFSNKIINNYYKDSSYSSINLFKHDDGSNYAFYLNSSYDLNMINFDNDGNLIHQFSNALDNHVCEDELGSYDNGQFYADIKIKVAQLFEGFLVYVTINYTDYSYCGTICGHSFDYGVPISGLFIKIDRNFNYLYHQMSIRTNYDFIDGNPNLLHMVTNNSYVLCVCSNFTYYYFELFKFDVMLPHNLESVFSSQIGNTIVDVQMNANYVFFLCKDKKLKIFDLSIQSGKLVKEIETTANQLKLSSTEKIVLFDSVKRRVCLYEQFGDFCKLEEVDLSQSLEVDLMINHDQSTCLAFYNTKCMKYTSLD